MMLSYSEARQFHQCQRKWFFKNVLASWNAKDPIRREAFVLSKLQSISAWRGSIVDAVLSTIVLPRMQHRASVPVNDVVGAARTVFEKQRQFALAHRVREPGMKVSMHGNAFAAWHDLEYAVPPSEDVLDRAWTEIEVSLRNALAMTDLLTDLRRRRLLIQPRLFHDIDTLKVAANPDVVAFGTDQSVRILDWKVHSFGQRAAKQQLSLYAGVVHRAAPQGFYPFDPRTVSLDRFVLTEVQLLNDEVYDYSVAEDDIDDVFDELFDGAEVIRLSRGADGPEDRCADEFPVTDWVESCVRCSFKRICSGSEA